MRTSLEFPDPVYREIRVRAANEGKTMRDIILDGVAMRLQSEIPTVSTREGRPVPVSLKEPRLSEAGRGRCLRVHSFSLM